MSVGLEVLGSPRSRGDDLLSRIHTYVRSKHGHLLRSSAIGDDDGVPTLFATVHPAAEPIYIHSEGGNLRVSAQTSSVGPGYHYFVCDLLRDLERGCDIVWQPGDDEVGDETGYLESGDRRAVEDVMLGWLRALCKLVLEDPGFAEIDNVIALPIGTTYRPGEFLVTQMGPRSREWAVAVAQDGASGKDFFSWWNAEQDASFHLNRALCQMWSEVRWRAPLTEGETALLSRIANDLAQAYRLDPGLDYPWTEWHEILGWLGEADTLPRVDLQRQPLIGYRRKHVRATVPGGWSIEIPGSFAEELQEDGTWLAWDSEMTVWVTAFSSRNEGAETSAHDLVGRFEEQIEDGVAFESDGIVGRGAFNRVKEGDEEYPSLKGRVAVDGRFVITTICYDDERQQDEALRIFKSFTR